MTEPAERTRLAWDRTALALLSTGVLLLLRHPDPAALVVGGFGSVLATAVAIVGLRRQRALRRSSVPVAAGSVLLVGGVVVAFGLSVVLMMAIGAPGLR